MVDRGRSTTVPNQEIESLLEAARISCTPFTQAHSEIAYAAFLRYGKGSGHPAKLNFNDCISYALAKSLDAPLLYKGEDFAQTDIVSAL